METQRQSADLAEYGGLAIERRRFKEFDAGGSRGQQGDREARPKEGSERKSRVLRKKYGRTGTASAGDDVLDADEP